MLATLPTAATSWSSASRSRMWSRTTGDSERLVSRARFRAASRSPIGARTPAVHDAASGISCGRAKELMQSEPGKGDRVAEQRCRVLVVDAGDRGVGGGGGGVPERDAAGRRLPPQLADRCQPGGPVE